MPLLLLVLACADEHVLDTGDTEPDACEPRTPEEPSRFVGEEPRLARTVSGVLTTTLDFDADAEATGMVDCSYTREYPLLEEIRDQGWLCPECAWYTGGSTEVVEGYESCLAQISAAEAVRGEHLGVRDDGATLWLMRSGIENLPLADVDAPLDRGAVESGEPFAVQFTDTGALDTGGNVTLAVAGTLTLGMSDTLLPDPRVPRTEPYACGWPTLNPGGEVPTWVATDGEVFPNARLRDPCGEDVDLWDFRGRYVVLDAASPDCGPCQVMAEAAEAFKAELADLCIEVETITVLNAGLRSVNLAPDDDTLQSWVERFDVRGPVLADKGFGYDVIGPFVGDGAGMSLPSAIVLDPEGRVIGGDHGYSEDDGGWARYGRFILEDVAAREAAATE